MRGLATAGAATREVIFSARRRQLTTARPLALAAAAAAATAVLAGPSAARADSLFWDADGGGTTLDYGAGTWSSTAPLWYDVTPATAVYTGWINDAATVANIGSLNAVGTPALSYATPTTGPYAMTLGESITVGSVTVSSNLGTGRDITIAGTGAGFTVTISGAGQNVLNNATGSALIFDAQVLGTNIQKANNGRVVFNQANGYTGATTVSAGQLQFNLPAAIGGTGRSMTIAAGGTAIPGYAGDVNGTFLSRVTTASTGTVGLTAANAGETFDFSAATGNDLQASLGTNGTVTFTGMFVPNGTTYRIGGGGGTFTFAPVIAGAFDVVVGSGSGGTTIPNAANTYTGVTTVSAGTLQATALANGGAPSSIGSASADPANLVLNGSTLRYTGPAASSDRGFTVGTGGATLDASGTGALTLSGTAAVGLAGTDAARTLTLTGTSTAANALAAAIGNNGTGATSVLKTGTGTWNLTGAGSTYTGATSVNQGTLGLAATGLSLPGALNFGSANSTTTAGTVLVSADAAVGSLVAQTNSTANVNVLNVAAGRTLTVNGNVTFGSSAAAATNTRLSTAGGGTLAVTSAVAAAELRVGGYTGSTAGQGNVSVADLTGLGTFTLDYSGATSVVRVNDLSSVNVSNIFSTLRLAPTSTLRANLLAVGDSAQNNNGVVNKLFLGSAVNTLRFNTINLGTGSRDAGAVGFDPADTTGSVVVRAADGAGRAALNVASTGGGTGVLGSGNAFDASGHTADLLLDVVQVGRQNRGNVSTAAFGFSAGTLDANSFVVGTRSANPSTGSAAFTTDASVSIGGGTATIRNGFTQLGQVSGTATNAGTAVVATLNVTGGNVTIGTAGTTTTAITMASSSIATASATGTINLTGGTVTVNGNIVRGGGAGTTTANLTLNGATLDMNGANIGDATNPINALVLQSGTLRNVGQINGGGAVAKTGTGILTLTGANNYTGQTNITAGALLANSASATGTGPVVVGITGTLGGTLGGTGSVAGAVTVNGGGTLAPGASVGTLSVGGPVAFADPAGGPAGTFLVELNPGGVGDQLALTGGGANGALTIAPGNALNVVPLGAIGGSTVYTIATFASEVGMFSNVLVNGQPAQSTSAGSGNFVSVAYNPTNIQITVANAVPEPAAAGTLGLAAVGLLARRRRRRP